MIAGLALVLVLIMISFLPALLEASDSVPPGYLVKPNCTDFKCGNFVIPYPFGMGEDCYSSTWFSINCNRSFNPPKLFLNHAILNLEVLNISLWDKTVTVNSPITSLCNSTDGKMTETKPSITDLNPSPFWFSTPDNIFMVLGCGSARLINQSKAVMAGCGSICPNGWAYAKDCFGINCCQTTISSNGSYVFKKYSVDFTTENDNNGCMMTHALMVDRVWFSRHFSSPAVIQAGYAPLVLLWRIENHDRYASSRCRESFFFFL